MADGNPFAPPQVNIAGGIQGLITQYQTAQKLRKQQELEATRKSTLAKLMSGGDYQEGIKGLLSAGDPEGAMMVAKIAHTMQGPTVKPMTPLQEAQLAHLHWQETEGTKPPEQKLYDWVYGQQGAPQETTTQPAAAGGAAPQGTAVPTHAEFLAQRRASPKSSPMAVEDAKLHFQNLDDQLSRLGSMADEIRNDPDLPSATGGWVNFLSRSPTPGAGMGNILPESVLIGTKTGDLRAKIKNVGQQVGLQAIALMREASKTGATGFSRITNLDLITLQNLLGPLGITTDAQGNVKTSDINISPELMKETLGKIKGFTDNVRRREKTAFQQKYGSLPEGPTQQEAATPPDAGVPMPAGMQGIATPPSAGTVPTQPAPVAMTRNIGGKSYPVPASDKVQLFRQYRNNPEAVAAFKELYGPDADRRYLGGQ